MKTIIRQVKTNKTQIFFILISFLVILISASTCSAADYYVNATAPAGGTGNETNPFQTIQQGVDAANTDGDIINIVDGTYTGENNTKIIINKNMTIIGQSQTETIVDGENKTWIFFIQSGVNVKIQNLTLKNGNINYLYHSNGGAIYNIGNLTVENCTFLNNTASYGSGGAI